MCLGYLFQTEQAFEAGEGKTEIRFTAVSGFIPNAFICRAVGIRHSMGGDTFRESQAGI